MGPCTYILNTWAVEYFLDRDFGAQVYNNEVHGPLGVGRRTPSSGFLVPFCGG